MTIAITAFLSIASFGRVSAAPIDPADAPPYIGLKSYIVVEGDTLLGIANRFGITPETIIWANDLKTKDLLKIGQKLTILPVSGVLHQVRVGESILGIAKMYGVEASTIVEANRISNPELIRDGNILLVPGGVKSATAASGGGSPSGGSVEALSYQVKPGDTLFSIASTFGVKVSSILTANGMTNPDYLKVGQLLSIPGGQPPSDDLAASPLAQLPAQIPPPAPEQERESSSRGNQGNANSFIATVTSYCLQGRTRTGTPVHWGVVAVDPKVIPLGSKIQIEGFEETFVAEDTGSGIRGNWIDIWFENCADARAFGTQSRRVTILER